MTKSRDAKKPALGKGLDALLSGTAEGGAPERVPDGGASDVPLTQIRPNPCQPRVAFGEAALADLKASMKERGLLQPIVLRPVKDGYQIVAGERRWRAATELQWEKIPAIVKVLDDAEAVEVALIENLQREDLNPVDAARALRYLADEFRMTQDEIAEKIGKDRSTVANSMRLLQLPDEIQAMLSRGEISAGHARALLRINSAQRQKELAKKVIEKGLSVRELEQMTSDVEELPTGKRKHVQRDTDLAFMEEKLQRCLGRKLSIKGSADRGRIEISYYSLEELNRLIYQLESLSQSHTV